MVARRHLLGGAVAARFASAHPGRVHRLVLVDTLGLAWYRPAARFALAMIGFVARPNESTQDRLFRYCMADLDSLRDDMGGRMERLEAYALDRANDPKLGKALRGLMPRMRLLDIAAGSGALAIPAARRGARVLATDIAPTMIERLRGRAREEGLSNLEARVMDGHSLDLEDDSFDLSASQNGVSLFPDLKRGLREMVRVTRPGGRAMIVTFGPMRSVEFVNFFMGAVTASVPGFEGLLTEPPPLPFQVADPGKLRREMTEAGLSDVRVEGVDWPMEFRSGSHFWDTILSSNPIAGAILSDLTEEQTREVRRVTDGMIRERFVDGPAVLHNRVNIGIGTK